jgi:hypothetical protein
LLSGRPNAERQDDAVKQLPQALPPAKDYVDEIAINWQRRCYFCWRARFLELNEVSRRHAEQKGGGGRVSAVAAAVISGSSCGKRTTD